MKKIEELTGFRKPNEYEKEWIGRYFEKVFQGKIKVYKGISSILCVVGVFSMSAYSVGGIMAFVIGIVAFALVFDTIWKKKEYQENIRALKNGQFQVMEGNVAEIFADTEYPGCCNARFQSLRGETLKMLCTVRQEELQIGTPLLLAYADESVIKGGISRAFTPCMLTEEGMKRWL